MSCTAGKFVGQVDEDLYQQISSIYEHFEEEIVADAVDGNDPLSLEKLHREISEATERSKRVWEGINHGLRQSVIALRRDNPKQIPLNDQRVAYERIADDMSSLPHPTSLFSDGEAEEKLANAAEDIIRFVQQDLCEAIDIKIS